MSPSFAAHGGRCLEDGAFSAKVMEDVGAALRAPLSYFGDRLGIFKAMAGAEPTTAAELALKTGLNGRYMRAWLEAMTAAEYIVYRPAEKRFVLPPEHAAVLATEESPEFMGGMLGGLAHIAMAAPHVQDAFRTGKGVPYSAYAPEVFESIARSSAPGFKHQLVQKWIPAMPEVEKRLRAGADRDGEGISAIAILGL